MSELTVDVTYSLTADITETITIDADDLADWMDVPLDQVVETCNLDARILREFMDSGRDGLREFVSLPPNAEYDVVAAVARGRVT